MLGFCKSSDICMYVLMVIVNEPWCGQAKTADMDEITTKVIMKYRVIESALVMGDIPIYNSKISKKLHDINHVQHLN